MTKFTVIFSISIALIVFLVAGAFVYVDISGRTTFDYSQFAGDKLFARTKQIIVDNLKIFIYIYR